MKLEKNILEYLRILKSGFSNTYNKKESLLLLETYIEKFSNGINYKNGKVFINSKEIQKVANELLSLCPNDYHKEIKEIEQNLHISISWV